MGSIPIFGSKKYMNIEFTKMHGLGNDFVVIDNMNGRIKLTPEDVVLLCDRHKGVGADGVILVEAKEGAHCFMNYINADGTYAQMCGNGVRCTAKFIKNYFYKQINNLNIATRSGIKNITCFDDGTFSVNMGKASFENEDFPSEPVEINNLKLNFVSMGNPFAITLVESLASNDIGVLGPMIENHPKFPNRMNLELVEEVNSREYKVRVWERGCGETMACGTGACAVYSYLKSLDKKEGEIVIEFPGGKLYISENEKEEIIMRGPAVSVYSGMVELI